jgi:sugar lactone lactonase YvrE
LDVVVSPDARKAYYLDWNNHVIREYGADRRVRLIAGTGELQDGEDPPVAPGAPRVAVPALRARLNHPTHMTFDAQGRLVVAAWHNSMIKRITNVGEPTSMIEDLCGTGGRNFRGDGGPALMAVLDLPVGVAISSNGDLFISDQANQRIRKVDGMGVITTVVGNGMRAYSGDGGPALMASLNAPIGQAAPPASRIEVDAMGNLYIADTGNNAVRRVDTAGVITTIAGTGVAGYSGDGMPARMAQLNGPTDIDVAPDGTLYIADTQNHCIRHITRDGVMETTVGRCGTRGFAGDGRPVIEGLLDRPYGLDVDTMGRMWIADTHNQRIRVYTMR